MKSIKMETRDHFGWLAQYKTGSRRQAERAWGYWTEYLGDKDESWVLNNPHTEDWGAHLVNFRTWLSEQESARGKPGTGKRTLSDNYTKTIAALIRGYLQYVRATVSLDRKQKVALAKVEERPYSDYPFKLEDKKRILEIADPVEEYAVSVGVSFGLRISDFIKFRRGDLEPFVDKEPPIEIPTVQTKKIGVKAHPYIDRDAQHAIKRLLRMMDKEKRTDPNEPMLKFTSGRPKRDVNKILKRLFENAGISNGNFVVRFHILRKFLTDNLASICAEDKWKFFVGKRCKSSYVSTRNAREDYRQVMRFTNIREEEEKKTGVSKETVDGLLNRIEQLEMSNQHHLTKIEKLTDNVEYYTMITDGLVTFIQSIRSEIKNPEAQKIVQKIIHPSFGKESKQKKT